MKYFLCRFLFTITISSCALLMHGCGGGGGDGGSSSEQNTRVEKVIGPEGGFTADEIIAIQIKYKISTNQGSNAALFAADFRALPRSILHEFSFDTIDLMGNEQIYTLEIETPSKSLIDMYVKQWREYDQDEYLVLAVGDFTTGK